MNSDTPRTFMVQPNSSRRRMWELVNYRITDIDVDTKIIDNSSDGILAKL